MEELPDDIILDDLWIDLPYQDILNLCQTNTNFSYVCQYNRTWKILLNRDFGIDYKGPNCRELYVTYYSIINYFSNWFRMITQTALLFISKYVPKEFWHIIIEQEELQRRLGFFHEILAVNDVTSLLDEARVINIPQDNSSMYLNFNEMVQSVLDNNCNQLLKLANKETYVFINKRLVIVNYDLDLAFELNLVTSMEHDVECYHIVKSIYDHLVRL